MRFRRVYVHRLLAERDAATRSDQEHRTYGALHNQNKAVRSSSNSNIGFGQSSSSSSRRSNLRCSIDGATHLVPLPRAAYRPGLGQSGLPRLPVAELRRDHHGGADGAGRGALVSLPEDSPQSPNIRWHCPHLPPEHPAGNRVHLSQAPADNAAHSIFLLTILCSAPLGTCSAPLVRRLTHLTRFAHRTHQTH